MFSDFGVRPAQRDRAKNSRSRKARRSRKMQTQPAEWAENRSTPHGSAVASSAVSTHNGNEKAMETGKQWRQESNGDKKIMETRSNGDEKTLETRKQWRRESSGDNKTMETRKQWGQENNGDEKAMRRERYLPKQFVLESTLQGCISQNIFSCKADCTFFQFGLQDKLYWKIQPCN